MTDNNPKHHGSGANLTLVTNVYTKLIGAVPSTTGAPHDPGWVYSNLLQYDNETDQTVEAIVSLENDDLGNAEITVHSSDISSSIATYHIHSEKSGTGHYLWYISFDGPEEVPVSSISEAEIIVETVDDVEDINSANNDGKRKARSVTVDAIGSGQV